jgi:murein DD-endopeptidase MepM/ murein hydrolase activator NlpD
MSDNKLFKDMGYKVTSIYGWRTLNGAKEFHPGVDLVVAPNGPLKAFTDGEVVWASEGVSGSGYGSYGLVVAIKDKNGCCHVYGHLSKILVKKGDKIKKGTVVGNQGNTGHSFGQHLHYEIRKQVAYVQDREKRCHVPDDYLTKFLGGSEVEMKAETANAIIKYLSKAHKEADEKEKKTIHALANELRKISGQELK